MEKGERKKAVEEKPKWTRQRGTGWQARYHDPSDDFVYLERFCPAPALRDQRFAAHRLA